MKFYETPEFKALNAQWRQKLAQKNSGFNDIEDAEENIIQRHVETHSTKRVLNFFENLDFFLKLDAWLQTVKLPRRQRNILEMYAQGVQVTEIAERKGVSRQYATRIITKARKALSTL